MASPIARPADAAPDEGPGVLRRSPRLVGRNVFRAQSGRVMHCTRNAAQDYKSPFKSPKPSKAATPKENNVDPNGTPRVGKRKSETTITPLRLEFGSVPPAPVQKMADPPPPVVFPKQPAVFNFCSLPEDVKDKYCQQRKITNLYDWQKECLSDHRLLRGSNCIISLPTGAGKTLIAEILMLREAVLNKRSSILVLPYVAIVQEKINSLSFFEEQFGIMVEEYAANKGRIPPIKRRKAASIFVATIEKANMLINSLIETERLDSIGLLVIDELHMVGDGSRGAILEQLLTKFLFKGTGQVVGMSATLSNMHQLATFLRAFVFTTDFRPIELKEYVKLGNSMWRVDQGKLIFDADLPKNNVEKMDPDGICLLLQGVIPTKSVIIFCPTKKNCENVAALIARVVPKAIRERRMEEKLKLIEALKEDGDGNIDKDLENLLMSGVAFHHSGLTHDERKHIEAAYCEGILVVICATSTLAAGVNLPARRVIIKAPMVGRDPLGKAQYLQMIGRAGRAGFDTKGDSITIVRQGAEERQFREMLNSPMLSCSSSLAAKEHLMSFVLDLVALKLAKNVDDVMEVLRFSLLLAQKDFSEVFLLVEKTAKELVEGTMLSASEEGTLSSTQLGNSTYDANLDPLEAATLDGNLKSALGQGIVFSSHFHLLFTIAPHDVACEVDWDRFHDEYRRLPAGEKHLLESSGLPEKRIIHALVSKKRLEAGDPAMRLYLGLMLQKVWNQEPHGAIAQKFGVERGWMQSVLQNAISRASAIARFSEKQPALWPFRLLLPELVQRLSDCVHSELITLMAIDGVKRGRAHQLYTAGFRTVAAVAKADYKDLLNTIQNIRKFQAIKVVNSARALLRDQVDEKLEEFEALGIDLNDIPR